MYPIVLVCLCSLQWAVVGDTFPVGCKYQNSIVFRDTTFLKNPDDKDPSYKSVLSCSLIQVINLNLMVYFVH